jgi:hypothetical protein
MVSTDAGSAGVLAVVATAGAARAEACTSVAVGPLWLVLASEPVNRSSIGRKAANSRSPIGLGDTGVVGSAGATGFSPTIVNTSEITVAATPITLRGGGGMGVTCVEEVTGKFIAESGGVEMVVDAEAVIGPPAAAGICGRLIDPPGAGGKPFDGGVVAAAALGPSSAVGD